MLGLVEEQAGQTVDGKSVHEPARHGIHIEHAKEAEGRVVGKNVVDQIYPLCAGEQEPAHESGQGRMGRGHPVTEHSIEEEKEKNRHQGVVEYENMVGAELGMQAVFHARDLVMGPVVVQVFALEEGISGEGVALGEFGDQGHAPDKIRCKIGPVSPPFRQGSAHIAEGGNDQGQC